MVVSDPTDKAIADGGDRLSVDECCLASKVFIGHVESLAGRCDAVFVPCYPTSDHRSGFCTKFQSATDMVRNTFRDDKLRVISCEVQNARKVKDVRRAFCDMAARMASPPRTPALPSKPPGMPSAPTTRLWPTPRSARCAV